jgi:hypothetical protein
MPPFSSNSPPARQPLAMSNERVGPVLPSVGRPNMGVNAPPMRAGTPGPIVNTAANDYGSTTLIEAQRRHEQMLNNSTMNLATVNVGGAPTTASKSEVEEAALRKILELQEKHHQAARASRQGARGDCKNPGGAERHGEAEAARVDARAHNVVQGHQEGPQVRVLRRQATGCQSGVLTIPSANRSSVARSVPHCCTAIQTHRSQAQCRPRSSNSNSNNNSNNSNNRCVRPLKCFSRRRRWSAPATRTSPARAHHAALARPPDSDLGRRVSRAISRAASQYGGGSRWTGAATTRRRAARAALADAPRRGAAAAAVAPRRQTFRRRRPLRRLSGVGGAPLPPPPDGGRRLWPAATAAVAAAAPVEAPPTYASDARYAKFLKMAKLGAAHGQLRPQMLAEGLNPAALDNPNGPIEDLPPSTAATSDLISPRLRRPHSDTRELQRPVIEEQPTVVNPAELLSGLKKSTSRTSVTAGVTTSSGAPVPPVDLKQALTRTGTDLSALDKKATIKPSEAVNSPAVQLRKTGKEITLARGGKTGSPRGRGGGTGGPMSPALRGRSSGASSPRRGGATTSPRSNEGGDDQAGGDDAADDEHNNNNDGGESGRQLNVSGGMSTSLELPSVPLQDTSDAVYMALPPELDELSRERELSTRDNESAPSRRRCRLHL